MLKQVECFTAGPYLDGLISVLTDPVWSVVGFHTRYLHFRVKLDLPVYLLSFGSFSGICEVCTSFSVQKTISGKRKLFWW